MVSVSDTVEPMSSNTAIVYSNTSSVTKSLLKTHTLKRNTVTTSYNGTQGTDFFFHSKKVPFNTGTSSILGVPDLRDYKPYPPKIGLRYACVPFKTGLAVYCLNEKQTH